ncbi:MAG: hypothetical protein M1831_005523 [Alyxoria varia]|nr:MAG: hypothetical protein M1831_005523 [Alyxoria varia]
MVSAPSPHGREDQEEKSSDSNRIIAKKSKKDRREPAKPKAGWKALFAFTTGRHATPLGVAIGFALASGIIPPAFAILLGKIFDQFTDFGAQRLTSAEFEHRMGSLSTYVTVVGAASLILNGCFFMVWVMFGELQAQVCRMNIFEGLSQKSIEWYDMRKSGTGALITRIQSQVRELQLATSQPLGYAAHYSVTAVTSLGVAFYYCWNLTLVILATLPISAFFLSWLSMRMQPSINAQQEELSAASKSSGNAFQNIETVKCFNGQDTEIVRFTASISKAAKKYMIQAKINAVEFGFVRSVTILMFVQGFWYGHHLVSKGEEDTGTVITTFWSCLTATEAIENILPFLLVLEKGRGAGAALRAIVFHQSWAGGRSRGVIPRHCKGDIVFRNVSFVYPSRPDQLVLNNFTGTFVHGKTTFLIGKSGSGKSTISQLLLRFYIALSGDVLLDGTHFEDIDANWLRSNITLVEQTSVLFQGTVVENISMGRGGPLKVSMDDVRIASEFAMLQQTINDMPNGLDTNIGAKGASLSGGQRQRLALARARLRDTPILILDESTSALDQTTRSLVMSAIRIWRTGKTTIIISHDMSQIQQDDFVYVLKDGMLVQEGFGTALSRVVSAEPKDIIKSFELSVPEEPYTSMSEKRTTRWVAKPPKNAPFPRQPSYDGSASPEADYSSNRMSFIPSVFAAPTPNHTGRRGSFAVGALSTGAPTPFGGSVPSSSLQTGRSSQLKTSQPKPLPSLPEQASTSKRRTQRFSMGAIELVESTGMSALQNRVSGNGSQRGRRSETSMSEGSTPFEAPEDSVDVDNSQAGQTRQVYPMRRIFRTVWPTLNSKQRTLAVLGFSSAAIRAVSTPVFSWIFSKLLATFFDSKNGEAAALKWSLSIIAIAFIDGVACFFMHSLLEYCGQIWVDTIRSRAMTRIMDQPRTFFSDEANSPAQLSQTLDRNAEEMRNLLGRFAAFLLVALVMMGMSLIWSMVVCWKLTLVGLSITPVSYLVTRGFQSVSAKSEGESNDAADNASSVLNETFTNVRTVRALTLENHFESKHTNAINRVLRVGFRRAMYCGLFYGVSEAIAYVVYALIFWYGAKLAAAHEFSIDDILLVFSMLLFSMNNLTSIIGFVPQIQASKDNATRLLQLSQMPEDSHERFGNVRSPVDGDIVCKDLSFGYSSHPDSQVLFNVNVTFPRGTCTAIVGSSGSGKSTIAALLLRMYPVPFSTSLSISPSNNSDRSGFTSLFSASTPSTLSTPRSGTNLLPLQSAPRSQTYSPPGRPTCPITISSIPLTSLSTPHLRQYVVSVPQSTPLFPTTISENILYGLPSHSALRNPRNVRNAASAAGIHDFIVDLPSGYRTLVGDGGTGLSGGQTQRLAIARALVREPSVLILDEATSALDEGSAELVRESVLRAMGQRKQEGKGRELTVLMITHDKCMMEIADRIVVMEQGRVVEVGEYAELAGRRGGTLRGLLRGGEWET